MQHAKRRQGQAEAQAAPEAAEAAEAIGASTMTQDIDEFDDDRYVRLSNHLDQILTAGAPIKSSAVREIREELIRLDGRRDRRLLRDLAKASQVLTGTDAMELGGINMNGLIGDREAVEQAMRQQYLARQRNVYSSPVGDMVAEVQE